MIVAEWTTARSFSAAAAVLGALGTGLLFKGSFTYESHGGYMTPQLVQKMGQRNLPRQRLQRAGLALLTISFVLSGVSLFFE
jgi:hypothetical protein